jgi:TPP-dependent pyruvate/acetoin dehydrogenase alpha subunit
MTVNLPEDLNKRIFDIYEFLTPEQIIEDYRTAYRSRQASILGRKEVLSGHAKFGIFGDGKEVPQLAMAHVFEKGDFRSGYYRDQTFMFALGELTIREYFAQIYAHADLDYDPASGGRLMNAHFITKSMNPDGTWRNLMEQYNTAADVSPTAAQMPRLVGLAYASRVYRELDELKHLTQFSNNGSEVAFGTIGNASCAEGLFWETLNAIGVLRAPAVISIWDDGYGISVSNEHQILKQDLSSLLAGFQREEDGDGYNIYRVPAWDYAALLSAYQLAAKDAREDHIPAIIHVIETTQPQGHSTSGSHERYKSEERLAWEVEYDCITRMRRWMISEGIAPEEELDQYEKEDTKLVRKWQKEA